MAAVRLTDDPPPDVAAAAILQHARKLVAPSGGIISQADAGRILVDALDRGEPRAACRAAGQRQPCCALTGR